MTTMQKDAVALIQELPEEQIAALLVIMRAMSHEAQLKREDLEARRTAFKRLESLTRPIPDLDEKRELAAWREEKFDYTQWRQSFVDRISSFEDLDTSLAATKDKAQFNGRADIL